MVGAFRTQRDRDVRARRLSFHHQPPAVEALKDKERVTREQYCNVLADDQVGKWRFLEMTCNGEHFCNKSNNNCSPVA